MGVMFPRSVNRLNVENFELGGTRVTATAADLNRIASASVMVSAGSTLAVTVAAHNGKIINLDALAGSICTLPAATGSGAIFTFVTAILATSNSHIIKTASATDYLSGNVVASDNADGTATVFGTTGNGTTTQSDTVTLNRGTTGSVKIGGDCLVFTDVAAGYWNVMGSTVCTGGEATPFSATV